MLNPLTHWTPGSLVRYHGSLTHLHGTYTVHPCTCLSCTDNNEVHGVRFALKGAGGATVIACVHLHSITPA